MSGATASFVVRGRVSPLFKQGTGSKVAPACWAISALRPAVQESQREAHGNRWKPDPLARPAHAVPAPKHTVHHRKQTKNRSATPIANANSG